MSLPDVVAINYSRDVGWSGAIIAELCRDEPSSVDVTFNYDGGPEIGVWQQTLSPEEFGRALDLVSRSGYATLEGPSEVSPEEKFLAVGERQKGAALPTLRAFELRTLHPALSTLSVDLERMLASIRRHPLRVVHAGAGWTKPAFDPSELLEIEMVMGNTGRLPLEMGNPLDVAAGTWNGLRLVLIGSSGSEQATDLSPSHIRARPGFPSEATVILDPGKAIPFRIRKKVYLPPGRYSGRIEYYGMVENRENRQLVTGSLWRDLGPVDVRIGG
jgi:hypothetical protein